MSRFAGVTVLLTLLAALANGDVLYQEDFSEIPDRWRLRTAETDDTLFAGGSFHFDFNGPLGIVTDSAVFDTFTYSVTVRTTTADFLNVGVGFCVGADLSGYFFVIDNTKQFRLYKYLPGSTAAVFLNNLPGSAIDSVENRLTVSKLGRQIRLFCNGFFLDSLSDDTHQSGNIAFVFAGPVAVEYDDVLVTDEFADIPPQPCFSDTFGLSVLSGWYTGSVDPQTTVSLPGGGALRIASPQGATFSSPVFATGQYGDFSMQAVLSKQDGADSAFYGLTLVDVIQQTNFSFTIRTYTFWINSLKGFSVSRPDTADLDSVIDVTQMDTEDRIHGGTDRDTLMVLMDGGKYTFMANGDTLVSADVLSPEHFEVDGLGIVVNTGVTAECYSFMAAANTDFLCPVARPVLPVAGAGFSPGLSLSGPGMVFDVLGRVVGQRGRVPLADRPSGIYIIRDPALSGVDSRRTPILGPR